MALVGNHYLSEGQIQSLRPRVTFAICPIWEIRRTDGTRMYFASHDKPIKFQGDTYQPIGPSGSDMEHKEGGTATDFEMLGFLSSDSIRPIDIKAGRYDGAQIINHYVDWQRPWRWVRKHVWWIKTIGEDGTNFRVDVQGVERFLTVPSGRRYELECDLDFGGRKCTASPEVITNAVVDAAASTGTPILNNPNSRLAFSVTAGSWTPDKPMMMGRVIWTSGPNAGLKRDISAQGDGTSVRHLMMDQALPFPIKAGDTMTLQSGCDGTADTCRNIYNNIINFGGFDYMPSTEDLYRLPAINKVD